MLDGDAYEIFRIKRFNRFSNNSAMRIPEMVCLALCYRYVTVTQSKTKPVFKVVVNAKAFQVYLLGLGQIPFCCTFRLKKRSVYYPPVCHGVNFFEVLAILLSFITKFVTFTKFKIQKNINTILSVHTTYRAFILNLYFKYGQIINQSNNKPIK